MYLIELNHRILVDRQLFYMDRIAGNLSILNLFFILILLGYRYKAPILTANTP